MRGYLEFDDGGEEEEYEERKAELEYLELRQKLKESIRKKLNKEESGCGQSNSRDKKKKLPYDNYGSFFGPYQPVIAQRVIQESKSHSLNKKCSASASASASAATTTGPKVNEIQKQLLEKRRETRDYSFLFSDDEELPAPTKDPPLRNGSTPNSQVPLKSKQQPLEKKGGPVPVVNKAAAPVVAKNILPPSSKMHSSLPVPKQRKGLAEPNRGGKVIAKQPVALSKPQINKPISSHATLQDHHHPNKKKKPVRPFPDDYDNEDQKALSLIRKMFNTQRFANRDDDDSDMEANFNEIMKEERRSAKLARKEDQEQLRLIEEEDRRERMTKSAAKKRKLSYQ